MATGVLLVQLGTPDAPTPKAVRRYLREFLSDRRVVDLNPWLWKPILHGIILRVRPKRSAALYRRVWTEDGSPLLLTTDAQARGLAERLGPDVPVRFGMRYGRPGVAAALDELQQAGCDDLLVLPLFPQYSDATTASVKDAVEAWARARAKAPARRYIESFADHPAYIGALAHTVREAGFQAGPSRPLLMSFHGIPQRYADRGDPYPQECEATARALATALDLEDASWRLVYQSRFGREPWLQPYTDETLEALPRDGIHSVGIVSPAFVADCLETIDELGRENREVFENAGGGAYTRIDCINASPAAIDAFETIVRERL